MTHEESELLEALIGTLYLFEAHAKTEAELEQIRFARRLIAKAKGK